MRPPDVRPTTPLEVSVGSDILAQVILTVDDAVDRLVIADARTP